MIGTRELEDALSRHLARTLVNMHGSNAMAVDGVDQGVDLIAASALGHRYYEYLTGPAPMPGSDAAAAAFAAGVIVGRTARESEAALTVPQEEET